MENQQTRYARGGGDESVKSNADTNRIFELDSDKLLLLSKH